MRIRLGLSSLAAAVWLILVGAAQAEPLRIFYFIWIGYGPLFVAQEKGFFAKEGVEVELINSRGPHSRLLRTVCRPGRCGRGRHAGRSDVSPSRMRNLWCACSRSTNSRGGDGILATKDIQSIADLKGRSVAVSRGSLQQFYLTVLLKEVGLSEADIEVVDLAADDCRRGLHDAGGRCGGDLRTLAHHGQEV